MLSLPYIELSITKVTWLCLKLKTFITQLNVGSVHVVLYISSSVLYIIHTYFQLRCDNGTSLDREITLRRYIEVTEEIQKRKTRIHWSQVHSFI